MPVPGACRLIALCESSLLLYPEALLCAQLYAGQAGDTGVTTARPHPPGLTVQ